MKRIVLATAILFGVAAHADTSVWVDAMKHTRGDDALHADMDTCTQQVGHQLNGTPTSAVFKRCMRGHGWRFDHQKREQTWIDPDTGLTCHHSTFLGVGAAECSNY